MHFQHPVVFAVFLQMKKPVDRGNKKLFVACEARPSSGESAVFIQTRKISRARNRPLTNVHNNWFDKKIFTKRQASHAKPIARMSRQSVRVPIWLTTPSDTNPYALPKVANARLVMVSQLWSDWSSVIPHLRGCEKKKEEKRRYSSFSNACL
ncbi:hypothetical protein D917_04591 [Trichinella nativa]|uniref:Uncharacterized protein n=1 Tax=Trichinella nativa TaxID=6335 RepID=A0A1Y3E3X0_9BILA|nr:hypothetical protein D917_04591 [Trichinella nativa]